MRLYDGRLVRVSQFLGTTFRATFLARFCVPEFDSGFDGVPAPTIVPGRQVLEENAPSVPTEERHRVLRRNQGYYRLRYSIEPRIAIDPSAYVRRVPNEGPYDLAHMWDSDRFHVSML